MRRMAIGTVAGVAILIGSAVAAEAQQITPTGPLSLTPVAGSTTSTYTANVYLPTPCGFRVRLWVTDVTSGLDIHYSETVFSNPYANNTSISITANHTALAGGHELDYKVAMKVGTAWIPVGYPITGDKIHWTPIIVKSTRPSKSMTSVQQAPKLALQSVERDRRRE
jgi:hypothetical protein